MSVEFHLGHNDHHKVEDFIARGAAGVGAITLHAKAAKHQAAAADAAREAGIDVLYDTRTERMADADPEQQLIGVPAHSGARLDLDVLASSGQRRNEVIERVLEAHPDATTIVTPPSFFIETDRTARLAIDLAEGTRLASPKPVRPLLFISSRLSLAIKENLANELAAMGLDSIDLRVSPFSGESDSIRKIRDVFATADVFRDRGLKVILGHSGNIGQVAYALGHASGYSVGIGQNEHVDFRGALRRQTKPPKVKLDENGKRLGGGAWEGIYLPGLAATMARRSAVALLDHSDIRSRLGCRIDACGQSLTGPLDNSRTHYLHARSSDMAALSSRPAPWRAQMESDRLTRALEMRQLVNDRYRRPGVPALKVRTLESLLEDIREESAAAA